MQFIRTPAAAATTLVLVTAFVVAGSDPAHAVSAGCTAANAGAFDLAVGPNTLVTPITPGAFDRGDTLTITVAGPAQLAQINLVPSNTSFFSNPAAATTSKAIDEDGVAALLVSLFSQPATGAAITITCAAAGSGGGAGGGAGGGGAPGAGPAALTPEQQSDAIDIAATTVNGNRLPTTPAALPGAGRQTISRPQVFTRSREYRHKALWEEYQEALKDLFVRYHPQQRQFLGGDGDPEKAIDRFDRGTAAFDAGQPLPPEGLTDHRDGWRYGRNRRAIIDRYREAFEAAGLPMTDPNTFHDLSFPENEDFLEEPADPAELGDGDIVLFTPDANGRGFSFDMSTDTLRRHMALKLEDDGTAPAALPPLAIAGMPVNLWARGRGTLFDRQKRGGSDGWAAHVLSGVALRVNDGLTVGAFGSYLAARSETDLSGLDVDTRQGGGGAYARMALMEGLSLGVSASRETGEQDISGASASGTADIDAWSISSSIQGAIYLAPVLLSPSFAVSYTDFERDSYTDSAGTTIPGSRSRDTTLSAALTASRSIVFEEGWMRRLTPRASATLNYFAREDESLRISATEVIDLNDWGANLGAGITVLTRGSTRLSFDAGVLGIGQDTLGYTGQLQVEFGF